MLPLVAGQTVSLFGDFVAMFTLPYFVFSLTGEPLHLGLTAASETLPMLLFGIAAGVYLDRRRHLVRTLVGADLLRALVFAALALFAASGRVETWPVYALAFLTGSLAVVFDSGFQATMPSLLEEDMLILVNSRLALARTLMISVGPLVAGFAILLSSGFALAFLLDSVTFVVSAAFLTATRTVHPRRPSRVHAMRAEIREGLRFLLGDRRLRWATIGGTVTNLVFAPLEALLVFFVATEVLGLPAGNGGFSLTGEGLVIGLFFSLQALIGALGAAITPALARRLSLGHLYALGLALFGGGFLGVSLVHSFVAFVPAGIGLAGVTLVNVSFTTLRQRTTPRPLLGRVIAASRTLAWAGLPLGAAIGGAVAAVVGVVPVYVAGSAAVLGTAIAITGTELFRDPVMAEPERLA